MKLDEVHSVELENIMPLFANFSKLPTSILSWMEEYLSDSVVVWNEENRICFVTESTKKIIGYRKEELLGKPWYEMLQPLDFQLLENYMAEKRNEGIHQEVLHKNNQSVHVEIHVTSVIDEETGEELFVCFLRDLSNLKKANELIKQAEKMTVIGQLAASIAHEIRNPLTAIKGFLQLMQAGVDHKDEYYRIMHDEIEKIEAITSELLYLSKPSSFTMKEEEVSQLIQDVVVLLQSQAKLKNISIQVKEPITATIQCDRSQIKQVLINLVKNAIEAMDEPGEIIISVDVTSQHIVINIKDEGIGIPQEMEEQLVNAFFTTKEHGTGLGLNITEDILKNHGGFLKFKKNETKGSTFQLFFPKVENIKNGL